MTLREGGSKLIAVLAAALLWVPLAGTEPASAVGPTATITSGPADPTPTNDSTPTFGFTADDPLATFECSVDAVAFAACQSPYTTDPLLDGSHTFAVRALDALGNPGSPASQAFTVDTVAPDASIDSGPSGLTSDSTPTFDISSNDPSAQLLCEVDSGGFQDCSSPYTTSPLGDGSHTLTLSARDAAGNDDPTPAQRSFTVDTSIPVVTFTSAPDGPTNDSTPSFSFSSDITGSSFDCLLDGAAVDCPSGSYTSSSPLVDGAHTFQARGTSPAGAVGDYATRSFTVDTVAPDARIDSGPSGPIGDSTPTFGISSDDQSAQLLCEVDSGGFQDCSSPFTTGPLADGPHTLTVSARDAAGNGDASPAKTSFTVDTAPPETVIAAGPPARSEDTTPTFWFNSPDAGARFECRLDGAPYAPCSSPRTLGPLSLGSHVFAVRARDALGHVDPTPATLAFEVVAPPSSSGSSSSSAQAALARVASVLADDLVRAAQTLGTREVAMIRRRRVVTLMRIRAPLAGNIVMKAQRRRPGRRPLTVLRGSRTYAGPGTARLRLRLTRAGRRVLLRRRRSLPVVLRCIFTARSGFRISGDWGVVIPRAWLSRREVLRTARTALRVWLDERPHTIFLRNMRRTGAARVLVDPVWRHRSEWWYANLRVRQVGRRFPYRISDAYLWR